MNTQGIGLGLVISENIVKSFEGHIGVKSEFGKGSQFVFCFKLKDNFESNISEGISSNYQQKYLQKEKEDESINKI